MIRRTRLRRPIGLANGYAAHLRQAPPAAKEVYNSVAAPTPESKTPFKGSQLVMLRLSKRPLLSSLITYATTRQTFA